MTIQLDDHIFRHGETIWGAWYMQVARGVCVGVWVCFTFHTVVLFQVVVENVLTTSDHCTYEDAQL